MKCSDLTNKYIVNPTWELTPQILISPFSAQNLTDDGKDAPNSLAKDYLEKRFGNYALSIKGREAIYEVLQNYSLEPDDVVTIYTTSDNFYVSRCITDAIERVCKWSRKIEDKTRVIFVNHEFGYPCHEMDSIASLGLPIIEDRAHTFLTDDNMHEMGKYADYVIYSLPKAFPFQIGAVITSEKYPLQTNYSGLTEKYILGKMSRYVNEIEQIIEKRLHNYHYFVDALKELGIQPFFELEKGVVPGVFLFKWHSSIDFPKLKEFMQANGIESSVFYGEPAFYIPCHQNLTPGQCEYIVTLINYFNEHRNDKDF